MNYNSIIKLKKSKLIKINNNKIKLKQTNNLSNYIKNNNNNKNHHHFT